MIQVKNLNKYFNYKKNNEIHAINDTTLDFPETGLVCLLGPSGCGKTTLLNVIGGLDKVDSGEIIFNDQVMRKYHASQWDEIRNRYFGYIFQNYVLLPELTVYQNLEFVLKMLNLSKDEIDERIEYALAAVGMEKYKKRKPTQLSGGQQQRIAIARALVKSPAVVIADEPTGNLDERNTTQIMNIIKKISKECLVILVTHERRLAEFYGDVIIEISDGKIVNQMVVSADTELYHLYDNNIYLQEFTAETVQTDNLDVKYFYEDQKPKLALNIIFKDNTFYINSNQDNVKIKFIDQGNEIKIIDSKKPVFKQASIEEFDYHLPAITKNTKLKSVIKFKDTIKMAIAHLGGLRKRQKLLFLVFFLSAIMVVVGFINLFKATNVDEKKFLNENRNLVTVSDFNDSSYLDLVQLKEELEVDLLLGVSEKYIHRISNLQANIFSQTVGPIYFDVPNSILPIEVIKEPKLIVGKLPTKPREIVIDKYLVDVLLDEMNFKAQGIRYYDQFIGMTGFYNQSYGPNNNFEIVGIVDTNNPNFYCTLGEYRISFLNNNYMMDSSHDTSYALKETSYALKETSSALEYFQIDDYLNNEKPTRLLIQDVDLKEDEVIVSPHLATPDKKITLSNGITLNVVGVWTESTSDDLIVAPITLEKLFYDYLKNIRKLNVYTDNKAKMIEKAQSLGYTGVDVYQEQYNQEREINFNYELYITSLVILVASLIFLYFLMRSSLISRIYQVGVYRALGVKKTNIYKLFLSEILIITLLTSMVGVLAASIFINKVNSLFPVIFYPWYVSVVSIIFILGVNIMIGLLPAYHLLRLTPSEILSKYDI